MELPDYIHGVAVEWHRDFMNSPTMYLYVDGEKFEALKYGGWEAYDCNYLNYLGNRNYHTSYRKSVCGTGFSGRDIPLIMKDGSTTILKGPFAGLCVNGYMPMIVYKDNTMHGSAGINIKIELMEAILERYLPNIKFLEPGILSKEGYEENNLLTVRCSDAFRLNIPVESWYHESK